MLILTRKPGESLRIGDDIKISILEIKGNQVRVGITAPGTQRIYREEIFTLIQQQNREASEWHAEIKELPVGASSIIKRLGKSELKKTGTKNRRDDRRDIESERGGSKEQKAEPQEQMMMGKKPMDNDTDDEYRHVLNKSVREESLSFLDKKELASNLGAMKFDDDDAGNGGEGGA